MLAKEMPSLQTSVETLYQLNNDEQIRETCDRFIRAENRERGYKNWIAQQKQELAEKDEELAKKDAVIANKDAALATQKEELANKDVALAEQKEELTTQKTEIEHLKSLLLKHGIPLD